MRIGARVDFALAFIAWGVLAGMLITLYERFGGWAILAFIGPTLLGRQVLERSQESIDSSRAYRSREAALTQLSRQIDQERADERRLIAADLHDDVLQPLFKVTLLSQVLRSELAGESSDVVKDDIFELHEASQIAADEVRNLIGDLRRPGLGRAGLTAALRRLTQVFQERAPLSIHPSLLNLELEDTGRQLAIYQVAKEALTNAIHHSGALNVWVELSGTESL